MYGAGLWTPGCGEGVVGWYGEGLGDVRGNTVPGDLLSTENGEAGVGGWTDWCNVTV